MLASEAQCSSRRRNARLGGAIIRRACPSRFGKILVMDPLEWSNMWVSCSVQLGAMQRVPHVAKYAKVSSCVLICARGMQGLRPS